MSALVHGFVATAATICTTGAAAAAAAEMLVASISLRFSIFHSIVLLLLRSHANAGTSKAQVFGDPCGVPVVGFFSLLNHRDTRTRYPGTEVTDIFFEPEFYVISFRFVDDCFLALGYTRRYGVVSRIENTSHAFRDGHRYPPYKVGRKNFAPQL